MALSIDPLRTREGLRYNLSIFLLWLFVISALIGMARGEVDWFVPKTPINQVLGAVLLVLNFPVRTLRAWLVFLFAFLVGMVVEILGVETGVLFGEYYYGDNFGWKFMGVPWLIGVYWAVLTFLTGAIAHRLFRGRWWRVLTAALLMVGLDVLIEPLAHQFDFWHFAGDIAPFKNYIAWFVVAFGLQGVFVRLVVVTDFWYCLNHYLSQVAFFVGAMLIL